MNGRRTAALALVAFGIVLLPLFAGSASAAPIATSGRPHTPAVGYSASDGSFLVVWSEDRGTGTGLDIYGARVTRSGIVAGTEIPIIVKNGDQSDPALAFSVRNCAYLLVYTDDGGGIPTPPTTPGVPTPGNPLPPRVGQRRHHPRRLSRYHHLVQQRCKAWRARTALTGLLLRPPWARWTPSHRCSGNTRTWSPRRTVIGGGSRPPASTSQLPPFHHPRRGRRPQGCHRSRHPAAHLARLLPPAPPHRAIPA